MKTDRFFTAILIGIGAIILIAFAAFFVRNSASEYMTDATPEGVVNNYVLALYKQDYQKAYSYLADLATKPAYPEFLQAFTTEYLNPGTMSVKINDSSINDSEATVYLTFIESGNDLFREPYRNPQNAALMLQSGQWKIYHMPYPYFNWDWYQQEETTIKTVVP